MLREAEVGLAILGLQGLTEGGQGLHQLLRMHTCPIISVLKIGGSTEDLIAIRVFIRGYLLQVDFNV
jgi:hypothetical protein